MYSTLRREGGGCLLSGGASSGLLLKDMIIGFLGPCGTPLLYSYSSLLEHGSECGLVLHQEREGHFAQSSFNPIVSTRRALSALVPKMHT